jgi:hypothetical protein
MDLPSPEWIGVAAAVSSLYSASAKSIISLRIAAIIANALAMAYSYSHGTYPTFALNAILLPVNVWRLRAMWKLVHDIDDAIKGDLNVDWLLPYMYPVNFKAGDIMMTAGDYATEAFYVLEGEVLVGSDKVRGPGTLLGEIGLFTPNGLRITTVQCKTDVKAAKIGYSEIKTLYFQNPQFGFRLLHLITARLQEHVAVSTSQR